MGVAVASGPLRLIAGRATAVVVGAGVGDSLALLPKTQAEARIGRHKSAEVSRSFVRAGELGNLVILNCRGLRSFGSLRDRR
jgi:hypothetical protein